MLHRAIFCWFINQSRRKAEVCIFWSIWYFVLLTVMHVTLRVSMSAPHIDEKCQLTLRTYKSENICCYMRYVEIRRPNVDYNQWHSSRRYGRTSALFFIQTSDTLKNTAFWLIPWYKEWCKIRRNSQMLLECSLQGGFSQKFSSWFTACINSIRLANMWLSGVKFLQPDAHPVVSLSSFNSTLFCNYV